MKVIYTVAIAAAALAASMSAAAAQGANTGRPSYDMPRAYDRTPDGRETNFRQNTFWGPRYYYEDEQRPYRKTKAAKKKKYDDYDD